MTTWAEASAVANAIEEWSDAQIQCRSYGHPWRSRTVQHRPGLYTITQRCTRCRNERQQDMGEDGSIVSKWSITYRPGYLLEGLGRVGQDGRALLRLATLRSIPVEEVRDE